MAPGEDSAMSMRRIESEVLRLRRVRHQALGNARLVHPDLPAGAYALLLFIVENEPIRASDAVEALALDKGAVSRQVHQLEELGLVSCTEDPDDRRAHRLVLSDEGRARVAVLRDHRRQDFERRLSAWSPEDLEAFAASLGRYNASFEA
jgi:DNA-binding MarR family transcriptional regulator